MRQDVQQIPCLKPRKAAPHQTIKDRPFRQGKAQDGHRGLILFAVGAFRDQRQIGRWLRINHGGKVGFGQTECRRIITTPSREILNRLAVDGVNIRRHRPATVAQRLGNFAGIAAKLWIGGVTKANDGNRRQQWSCVRDSLAKIGCRMGRVPFTVGRSIEDDRFGRCVCFRREVVHISDMRRLPLPLQPERRRTCKPPSCASLRADQ